MNRPIQIEHKVWRLHPHQVLAPLHNGVIEISLAGKQYSNLEIARAHAAQQAARMIAADLQAEFAADGFPLLKDPGQHSWGVEIGNAKPNHLRLRLQATATDDLIVDREHAPGIAQHFGATFGESDAG